MVNPNPAPNPAAPGANPPVPPQPFQWGRAIANGLDGIVGFFTHPRRLIIPGLGAAVLYLAVTKNHDLQSPIRYWNGFQSPIQFHEPYVQWPIDMGIQPVLVDKVEGAVNGIKADSYAIGNEQIPVVSTYGPQGGKRQQQIYFPQDSTGRIIGAGHEIPSDAAEKFKAYLNQGKPLKQPETETEITREIEELEAKLRNLKK